MIRITGGDLRGRQIRTPRAPERGSGGTRPTQAKLRQALFNSLQLYIGDARVLDLFSGPGTLGFEALSRGAESVVFVESVRAVSRLIAENARELGVGDRVKVYAEPFERVAPKLAAEGPFDIVLADPPYAEGFERVILNDLPWERILKPVGHLCLEWGLVKSMVTELPEKTANLVKVREKNYGDSVLTTYRLLADGN